MLRVCVVGRGEKVRGCVHNVANVESSDRRAQEMSVMKAMKKKSLTDNRVVLSTILVQ